MPKNTLPAPQKNQVFGKEPDQDVMALIQRGGKGKELPAVKEAKQKVKDLMSKNNIDPKKMIQLGSMAFQAISDPALYPIVVQNAVQNKVISQSEVPDKIDYRFLGGLITSGKLADQIIKEGT